MTTELYVRAGMAVSTVTSLGVQRLGFDTQQGAGTFFSSPPCPDWLQGPPSLQPPVQWVPEVLTICIKPPEPEANHSPPNSAGVQNVCS